MEEANVNIDTLLCGGIKENSRKVILKCDEVNKRQIDRDLFAEILIDQKRNAKMKIDTGA